MEPRQLILLALLAQCIVVVIGRWLPLRDKQPVSRDLPYDIIARVSSWPLWIANLVLPPAHRALGVWRASFVMMVVAVAISVAQCTSASGGTNCSVRVTIAAVVHMAILGASMLCLVRFSQFTISRFDSGSRPSLRQATVSIGSMLVLVMVLTTIEAFVQILIPSAIGAHTWGEAASAMKVSAEHVGKCWCGLVTRGAAGDLLMAEMVVMTAPVYLWCLSVLTIIAWHVWTVLREWWSFGTRYLSVRPLPVSCAVGGAFEVVVALLN